ncbi:hypothetical protein DMUE_3930 [Dictyocoela muelleri]|nr:hypothetical protein DMUE_3930 [Dictyocoela muelleri]
MLDVKNNKCYLKKVEYRNAETLIPIIESKVPKNAYIISDSWSAYNSLNEIGYFHQTVCHKRNFVDPETKVNTQKIENLWMHLKKIKHYSYGINLSTIDEHLSVFMFFLEL